ncbi:MAG: precorrin-8X methylmutase [Chloroflexi bacterium]|nr:precorrin-8X methylmutase [Chloroflexota bacterium]
MVDCADTGVIILAHGTRGERGSAEMTSVLGRVTDGVKVLLSPRAVVSWASLQFNHPSLEEAAATMARAGVSRIIIVPYFLFPGRHITEHVPEEIAQLERAYPACRFVLAGHLGGSADFTALIAQSIIDAAPELSPESSSSPEPGQIERDSMAIIDGLLPPLPVSPAERDVVKRIVHTSGDPDIARLVKFSPTAVPSGLEAIAAGSPVFTDVRMVSTGVNKRLAGSFGCNVCCALDEVNGAQSGLTRTAVAMHHLGQRLNGAIVTIGNAPTALLALTSMIDAGQARPALVVGMPVGFIQARESKDELMRRDIPFISLAGTRGGSALAAATVNALLGLAVARVGAAGKK